jgi:hypothetical protein
LWRLFRLPLPVGGRSIRDTIHPKAQNNGAQDYNPGYLFEFPSRAHNHSSQESNCGGCHKATFTEILAPVRPEGLAGMTSHQIERL